MSKVKAREIREKSESDLLKSVQALKTELASLRVAKATGGAAAKIAKIYTVRKNIARTLTVYNQNRKEESVKAFAGKKFKPLDQRVKKTRAIRRALSKDQASKLTKKESTRRLNYPARKYAVTA
jgi:large subunit ribosomal protein L35e